MKKTDRLNDAINVPMARTLKRRIAALAMKFPGQPSYTKFARMILEASAARAEENGVETLGLPIEEEQAAAVS